MKLKNKEKWEEYLRLNPNGYGGVICKVAQRTMEKLDELDGELTHGYSGTNTPQGLIKESANETIDMGQFNDFLVKAVEEIVFYCHERGDEFRERYVEVG